MPKRILVPLDRSDAAQGVLPLVGHLARSSGATVRLLHVAPIPQGRVDDHGRVIAYASQEMERLEYKGLGYLKAAEAQLESVPVESVVRFGEPVEEILREAEAFAADLIALTTASRSWLRRVLGGGAGKVFRKADVPVMLLGTR